MSLNAALSLFLEEYPKESQKEFTGNPLGEFVRQELPQYVEQILKNDERYLVRGSVGQGNWAKVPWLAVFDRLITETAEYGYYVVYLVREDFSGVYLSLNQGVITVRQTYGSEAKDALRVRASDFLAQLGAIDDSYMLGPIDLRVTASSGLGAYYQEGSICAKFYDLGSIPDDVQLEQDLLAIINLYLTLARKALLTDSPLANEDDETDLGMEDLSLLREHKRIERNQRLAKKAKKALGFDCQICGFNFEEAYGDIGHAYIEAHHLLPLAQVKGQKIKLSPSNDFAVLCSNCHKMIHKTEFLGDIEAFKINHLMASKNNKK